MSNRFSQLAYTSFDRPGGAGGWQIKQSTADLSAEETQRLVSGVRTAFRPVEPLPDYPTPQQLEAFPRRLAYRRWARRDGGGSAYWHTAPAGADSTGRPGNVFAHVLLDRAPDTAPRLRPIQRWRAPSWLTPFGAVAVARTALPAEPPSAGQVVTKDSVVAFALDTSTWRLGTLLGLLDAVAAALDGGAPVVLGVSSVDSAAQWIGLVSFLMSPGTAAALNFSTFDRADQLGPALHARQHLSAVPVQDLEALPAGVVAIDETATLSLGELGGEPHRTGTGQPIEVTAWSVMAQEALLDPRSARAVLDEVDRYAAQTPDRGLHPAWPLAVTIAADDAFAGAHPEAQSVISAHTPGGVVAGSAAEGLINKTISELIGETTSDAWKAAEQDLPGFAGDQAELTYLCRAVADDTWLDQIGPIPVGSRTYRDRPVPAPLAEALGPALQRAGASGPQRLLQLVDLLMRAGIEDGRLDDALSEVAAQLADPHAGPALTRRFAHRLGTQTRIAVAAATLRAAGRRDMATISDAVLEWFADGSTMPAPEELLTAKPWDARWTRAAVRGMRAEREQTGDRLDQAHEPSEADRFAELWWLSACGSRRRDQLAAARIWDPAQLLVAGGATLSAAALLPTLLGAPNSAALVRLADDVIGANTDDVAVACAALRSVDPASWVRRGYIDSHQRAYAPLWDSALEQVAPGLPSGQVHHHFAVRVVTVAVIAGIAGQPRPARAEQLAADAAVADAATDQLLALVEDRVVKGSAIVASSLLRANTYQPGTPSNDSVDKAVDRAVDRAVDSVLAAAAAALADSGQVTEEDEEEVLTAMMHLGGEEAEGAPPRRYRKLVNAALTRRADARSPMAARMWRNH